MFLDVQLPDPSYGGFHQPFHDCQNRKLSFVDLLRRPFAGMVNTKNSQCRGVMWWGYVMS